MLAPRSLPGIEIDVASPPLTETLPRMDVAAFVGFASRGPTHCPVLVESVAQFAAIFGPDAPLAWDRERGARIYAFLGPTVRGFFANGGRRCWIIRVARTQALEAARANWRDDATQVEGVASSNRFPVPGVLSFPASGAPISPAYARAGSVGSWSDALRLSTALGARPIALLDCESLPDATGRRFRFRAASTPTAGELIAFDDVSADSARTIRVFATIDEIVASAGAAPWAEATIRAAFEALGGVLASPPHSEDVALEEAIGRGSVEAVPESKEALWRLRFTTAAPLKVAEGCWLRGSTQQETIWLRVDAITQKAAKFVAASPPGAPSLDIVAEGPAWRDVTTTFVPVDLPRRAVALTIDLMASEDGADDIRLDGVGLTQRHPNGWWRQASDDVLFAPSADGFSTRREALRSFVLAALDDERGDAAPLAWIPLGVEPLFGVAAKALPQEASALERDGLSRFGADLFLDPELASLTAEAVNERADAIRFLREPTRRLFGLHAALSIGAGGLFNEASLISAPDAAHLGWTRRGDIIPPPADPTPEAAPAHWFVHQGPCAQVPKDRAAEEPDFSNFLDCGTRALEAPQFIAPPRVVPTGVLRLEWTRSEAGLRFVVEEAQRADFKDARAVYDGAGVQCDLTASRPGVFYYRATAFNGNDKSRGSDAIAVVVRDDEWQAIAPAEFSLPGEAQPSRENDLLRVHRALLRLCAASGLMFAVLSAPRHYRAADLSRFAERLCALRGASRFVEEAEALDFNEGRVLSYGALYAPWVVFGMSPADGEAVQEAKRRDASPPDGVVTGVLAARATRRGAWIAPANEPFKSVVALTPPMESDAWATLQRAQINYIRDDARGFLTLDADTLAGDADLRPINVRRLLILLRRLTLRRAVSYVFEPNGATLRRAIERGFTFLLTELFRRGAFAGDRTEDSFRVSTMSSLGAAADEDAGRLLVELRVAPSLPMRFLVLRLVQSGERLSLREEL